MSEQARYTEHVYREYCGRHVEPIVQQEEIVRCRDCKYNDVVINACDHPWITPLRGDVPLNYIFSTVPDGFCAWGKRRGE